MTNVHPSSFIIPQEIKVEKRREKSKRAPSSRMKDNNDQTYLPSAMLLLS